MASSDPSTNPVLKLLTQCERFNSENDRWHLKAIDDSLFLLEYDSDVSLIDQRTVFVASSRLPQKLDEIPELFNGLLKLGMGLKIKSDVLLTAKGTACNAMVRRIGQLFRIPVVELRSGPLDPKKFGKEMSNFDPSDKSVVWVFDLKNRGVDFALANIAHHVTALSVRSGGNLHTALRHRLGDSKQTRLLVEPKLTKSKLTDELLSEGAVGWVLLGADEEEPAESVSDVNVLNNFESSDFLLHWTRRRVGPWPDQSDGDFLDDLIFQSSRKDHREIAALRRILATQRIFAGSELTRDPRPVVCFSDVSFEDLKELRTFRSHLSRWDFEPFGIAIRKSWLKQQGAAAVVYGDEKDWDAMPEQQRAFFQLNDPNGKIDWSVEREWRLIGDVDLRKVPIDAAVVFVREPSDVGEIAAFCRWPIVVLQK